MANITVLGANGFIGRHLVRRLATGNRNQIIAFDVFPDYHKDLENPFAETANVKIVPGNFFNREEVSTAIAGADFVFHLVSSTTPATSNNDPYIDVDTNLRASISLFELCVEHGVKKVIFPSSGGTIYGDIDSNQINELTLPQPQSPYGIVKLTIEHYLRYFQHRFGLDYTVYRIANPYGPGQNIYGKQGVIPIFMHQFLKKEPVTVFGDGTMVRDYIYIDDLIDMIAASYDKQSRHHEYNIGNGAGTSINDLLSVIEACTGYSVERQSAEIPATYVSKSVLDTQRFVKEFGVTPSTSLSDGIKRTWDYVKQLG